MISIWFPKKQILPEVPTTVAIKKYFKENYHTVCYFKQISGVILKK